MTDNFENKVAVDGPVVNEGELGSSTFSPRADGAINVGMTTMSPSSVYPNIGYKTPCNSRILPAFPAAGLADFGSLARSPYLLDRGSAPPLNPRGTR